MKGRSRFGCALAALSLLAAGSTAEVPTVLTDHISQGTGAIDVLKDVTGSQLSSYVSLNGGRMYFGVDLNENASGNEDANSIGVAIKTFTLSVTTTDGAYTFSNFYTNTSAVLQEQGTAGSASYYTLFGTTGANDLGGSLSSVDFSSYDDVVALNDVYFSGEVLSASLQVSFVRTAGSGSNESFFDFSGGFENFAILSGEDAVIIEQVAAGTQEAPATVTYEASTTLAAPEPAPDPGTGTSPGEAPAAAPAAPEPSWIILGAAALLAYGGARRKSRAR